MANFKSEHASTGPLLQDRQSDCKAKENLAKLGNGCGEDKLLLMQNGSFYIQGHTERVLRTLRPMKGNALIDEDLIIGRVG